MEKNIINNKDFEQFVKHNADQYKMFPSEKVWKGIHNRLHTRRWLGAGLAILLLSVGTATWVMLTNNNGSTNNTEKIATVTETYKPEKNIRIAEKISTAEIVAPVDRKKNSTKPASTTSITRQQQVNPISASEKVTVAAVNTTEQISKPVNNEPEIGITSPPAETTTETTGILKNNTIVPNNTQPEVRPDGNIINNEIPAANLETVPAAKEETASAAEKQFSTGTELLTIESVVNSYIRIKKREKTSLQFYFTPLVTYRSLHENKAFIKSARNITGAAQGSQYVYYMPDLKNVVIHKPDIGFNIGLAAGIPVTKNLRLLNGLQFNVNKYDIRAYQYRNEVAPVALSTDYGGTNTVYPVTSYRIVGGYNTKWLRNYYFSASLPVGAELKFVNNNKTSFGISATVQPTYVLDNRSYLISTDYKNYVEIPSLTRRWNINTGLEVFAGVKTGKTEWRISPQVRYQTLSSYKNSYPVKENLFDFGLKLGVMLK